MSLYINEKECKSLFTDEGKKITNAFFKGFLFFKLNSSGETEEPDPDDPVTPPVVDPDEPIVDPDPDEPEDPPIDTTKHVWYGPQLESSDSTTVDVDKVLSLIEGENCDIEEIGEIEEPVSYFVEVSFEDHIRVIWFIAPSQYKVTALDTTGNEWSGELHSQSVTIGDNSDLTLYYIIQEYGNGGYLSGTYTFKLSNNTEE